MSYNFEEKKYSLRDERDVSLFGAFPDGDTVRISVKVKDPDEAESVAMVIHADGWGGGKCTPVFIDLHRDGELFSCDLSADLLLKMFDLEHSGLFYYHYSVKYPDETVYLGGERPTELCPINIPDGERQLFIYRDDYKTSSAYREGITYHIFVDRFAKSGRCVPKERAVLNEDWEEGIPQYADVPGGHLENNEFFGGDLWGIAEKLDYIAELGTKTIYLSPIFDAYSNHKYDTGDYLSVDSMFGGDEALENLCKLAGERGINVILDGVFNHTGDDSLYFNKRGTYDSVGAYQSEESPYINWYSFGEYPDEYASWWGIKILPRVNSHNPDFRRFICSQVVEKWMNKGVSGWRLDVADEISNDFLTDFRQTVKRKNPDGVIIGEVWEDATDKISYGYRRKYFMGSQLDSVMNYPLRDAVISYVKVGDHEKLRYFTESTYRRYPKICSDNLMNFLGTHDTERVLTILGGEPSEGVSNRELAQMKMTPDQYRYAIERLKLSYGIIAGLPGVPAVFYGDEVGQEGYHDPFCRCPFPWHRIDYGLLREYRRFGQIRKKHPVFYDGLFRILKLTPDYFIYIREPYSKGQAESVIVAAVRHGQLNLEFDRDVRVLDEGDLGRKFLLRQGECVYFSCPAGTKLID